MGNISSNSKGMYKGKSHAEGGIPVVVDGNTNVEIEGNEYHLCRDAMSSAKIYSFKNKSNKEILDSIYSSEGCKFVQGIANSGDFIVCKLVVLDDDKRTITGTVKSIIDTMQSEKSCNVSDGSNKMEKGGGINSIFDGSDFKKEVSLIEDEIENQNLSYYNDTTTLSNKNALKEKEKITKLFKPLIDKIKEKIGSKSITLYRGQEERPNTNNGQYDGSVLSFTTKKEIAKKWAKEMSQSTNRSKANVIEVEVPFDNIIGVKTGLGQYEFYVKNEGVVKEIVDHYINKMEKGGGIENLNIENFMNWYKDWYKGVADKMNILISLPSIIAPFKEDNVVILDLFEKIDQNIDAKQYLKDIVDKADEYDVTIYLEPMPRYKFFLKNIEKRIKISKHYLISYYEKFDFKLTPNKIFMKRLPKDKMEKGGGIPNNIDVVNGFYSPLEKIISETKFDKLPAKQWIEKFANGDEAKWTGLKDWLLQQQGSISKADIQQYLKDNRIQIVEVVKSKEGYRDDWDRENDNKKDTTKFSQYQLEGEKENYKEVLVTMPTERSKIAQRRSELASLDRERPLTESEQEEYDDLQKRWRKDEGVFKFSHFDEPNILVHLRMNTRIDADGNKVLFLEEIQSDWGQKGKKAGFTQKESVIVVNGNVLVNNKVVATLKKIPFEIWMGKDLIERIKENPSNYRPLEFYKKQWEDDSTRRLLNEQTGERFTVSSEQEAIDYFVNDKGVPIAPFVTDTNAWTKLGLKVALKEAVKQGSDKIAWTTGEQQNERYDLSKQVDKIEIVKREVVDSYRAKTYKDGKILEDQDYIAFNQLEGIFGKEIAKKVQDGESVFEGEGLKVGGKGMKGFYGSTTDGTLGIVGNVAKSLFKQEPKTTEIIKGDKVEYDQVDNGSWSVRTKEYTKYFTSQKEAKEFAFSFGKNKSTQYSIDITPELKESTEAGLPMFKKGGSIDEHKETYEKWKSLVNMSKSELKEFYDSQEGKDAGLSDKESNDLGISNGRESARWIMRMKDTPVSDWIPKMWEWANKQISFISRMSGNKGSLYDDNGNKTRKHTSLLIWGHNPKKMSNGGEVITYRNKFNKKYGFELNESHSLEEIAKLTNLKLSALQDIYNKGIGAYKTNPESVRPIVKSKEQWAMARVYSAVMGGKASKVDANELERGKMADGGELAKGIKTEMEHKSTIDKFKRKGISDKEVAKSIAQDHLKEDSSYYSKLAKIEGEMEQGGEIGEEAQQLIDIISMYPNNPKYDRYKDLLKSKFNIDYDIDYANHDENIIENADLNDLKGKNEFLNYDNYVKYANKIFKLRGFIQNQPNHIEGVVNIELASKIGKELGFEVVFKEYNGYGNYAEALGNTIRMPKEVDINTFIHEIGHFFDHEYSNEYEGKAKNSLYATSLYFLGKSDEVFAENFMTYFIAPDWLKNNMPSVYYELDEKIPQNYKEIINNLIDSRNSLNLNIRYEDGGEVSDNKFNPVIMYHEKNGNWFIPKNTIYAWLYDVEDASAKLNSQEFDMVLFGVATMSMTFQKGYVPPLLRVWSPKYQKQTKGSKHLMGIVQAWYDEDKKKLYVEMMTTNPKQRRKGINGYIIKEIREGLELTKDDVIFDKPTDMGKSFMKSGKFEDGGEVSSSEYLNVLQKLGITEEERENWRESHKVNQKQIRNDKVKESAEKLKNGTIQQSEYLKIVAKEQPIKLFTEVPKLPTPKEIICAVNSNMVAKGIVGYTKHIEDGTNVASRLDIPAYENYDTWVVSIHDGITEKIITYGQTAYLKNVEFKTFPKTALNIATGSAKSTIGRMYGTWENKSPEDVRNMAVKYMNDPNWVQIGMNPFRHSWFYDKNDSMPLISAKEVIQVGALVLAKNPVKTTPDNDMFIADRRNPSIKFKQGGEIELKQKQLEIINRTNPAPNEYNTWIRTVKDIKTAEEVFSIAFEEGAMYPDFQMDDITKAIESGYVTIFSSYPIKEGVFVTTSKMNAQDYAGGKGGKVFSKKVQLKDIAWIDEGEGQYAPIEYFANGGNIPHSNMELLAPNGNKSNLNHEQWHLVRTPAFKQWFGDWEKLAMAKIKDSAMDEVTLANISKDVSKVVDSNGEPLVVYHSSNYDFNIFKDATDEGIQENSMFKSVGYYFTPNNVYFKYKYKKSFFLNVKNLVKIPQNSLNITSIDSIINILGKNSELIRELINLQKSDESDDGKVYPYMFFKDEITNKKDVLGTIVKKLAINKKIDGFTFLEEEFPCEQMGCPNLQTFVLFNSNQVKLADGTNTTFDGNNDDIRYEDGGGIPNNIDVVNGFYSPLEKIISETKFDKLPAKQWIEKFANGDEAKWTGLKDWLLQQQGSVSKADIQQYLKDNRIEIVEVVKGKVKREELRKVIVEPYVYNVINSKGEIVKKEVSESTADDYIENIYDGVDTKFSQYQLEGEKENYKEVLVTMPKTTERWDIIDNKGNVFNTVDTKVEAEGIANLAANVRKERFTVKKQVKTDFKSSHFDEPNILVHLRMNTRTDAEGNKVLFLEEIQSDWGQKGKREGFAEKLEHITKDNSTIEKIVDKESGFAYKLNYKGKYLAFVFKDEQNLFKNDTEINNILLHRANRDYARSQQNKTPTAPFVIDTNAWTKLGLKVALKEAVKQGADKIAWTTGEQQNDRYSLEKVADEVRYSKNSDGTYKIIAYKGGENISENKRLNEKDLESNFGKDVAQRIIDGVGENIEGEKSLTGENLKVGGKGMKGFYGSTTDGTLGIVGNVAKSLFKQEPKTVEIPEGKGIVGKPTVEQLEKAKKLALDAKDESSAKFLQDQIDKINVGKEYSYALFNSNEPASFFFDKVREPSIYTQHSIDITPKLKESTEAGLPMFKKGGEIEILLAPNGKPSNLAPEQYKLVRTPAFKAWFGDWENDAENSSKVVDYNGEPKIMYRGNPKEQEDLGYTFNKGYNFLNKKSNNNFGFFFTDDIDVAKKYMKVNIWGEIQGGSITQVFLNVKNLFDFTPLDYFVDGYTFANFLTSNKLNFLGYEKLIKTISDYNYYEKKELPTIYRFFDRFPRLNNFFIFNNIDGIVFKEKSRTYLPYSTYAVFDPNQIKLADGTNTTFDGNNDDIRYEEGGNIDESDLLKSYGIGETFSTKEFGLKHNISTALAYKKLCALEDMDLVFKYGYKTRNGWDDVDNSNLKPNSLHWQIPLSNSDMDDEDEIEYKDGGEIESHEEKITYESPDEMFFNLDTSNDLIISKSNASDTAIYEDGGDISTKNSLADIEYYKAKLIEKQDVKSVLTKKIEQDYEELRKLGYEEDTTRRRELNESRNNDRKYSEIIALEIMQYKNIVKCLDNGGSVVSVEDKHGNTINEIPSFIGVSTNLISFIEETILVDESPDYVPTIDEEVFRRKGYVFDAIRVSKNSYMVAFNGYKDIVTQNGVEKRTPTTYEQGYCIVSLDQLVLINDYYFTKARAVLKKEAEDKTKRQENYYDTVPIERRERILNQKNYYYSLPASVKKTITQTDYEALSTIEKEKLYKPYKRYASKRLSSKLEDNQMWISFHEMYQQFVNPEAYPVNKDGILQTGKKVGLGLYGNPEIFKYWYLFRDLMKFKIKDIKMQVEVDNEQYKKARETSFGDINTNDSLVSQYGILVKKQDGKQIGIDLIDQIESGWILISKMLGNLKSVAQADNLKISHTANTNVFASKAIGVYVPQMSTIAVSSKYGEEQFNNTFAHEVGHYVDHHLGKSKGMRYFTDDYEDKAGLIAFKFRSLMNKKSDSDYINSTKECFARAIEQHFAISNYGDNAQMFFTTASKGTIRPYFLDDSYVSKNSYYNILKPMIDEFIDSLEFGEKVKPVIVQEPKNEPIEEPISEDKQLLFDELRIIDEIMEFADGEDLEKLKEEKEIIQDLIKNF